MSKVVAIMSMSLDGYVADLNDGVAHVFDWYLNSGDVEIHTGGSDPMTFKVSEPSAEHLRGLTSGLGCVHAIAQVRLGITTRPNKSDMFGAGPQACGRPHRDVQ